MENTSTKADSLQFKLKRPFTESADSTSLVLTIAEELRDVPFVAYFGKIQRMADPRTSLADGQYFVRIDFRCCRWADPMPLLHLALFLREFLALFERNRAEVLFPSAEDAPRLLKFLSEEGFMQLFLKVPRLEIFSESRKLSRQDVEKFSKLRATLAYCDCHALSATVIDLSASNFDLNEWIEKISHEIETNIRDACPQWAREALVHKCRYFLNEALQNVCEHAYDEWPVPQRLAAIYLRFRKGIAPSDPQRRSLVIEASAREREACKLNPDFLMNRRGCIEAFVLDTGIGLVESLRRAKKVPKKKYPFPAACEAVFLRGLRCKDKNPGSSTGGLSILNHLLGRDRDYLRGYDDDTWVHDFNPYGSLGSNPSAAGWHSLAFGKDMCGQAMRGLAWTVRLSWMTPTDQPEDGWQWFPGDFLAQPLINGASALFGSDVYRKLATQCPIALDSEASTLPVTVGDWRFSAPDRGERQRFLNRGCSPSTRCVVFFPPRGLAKNEIIRLVEDASAAMKDAPSKSCRIVFCDVPQEEGRMYLRTLDKARFYEPFPHLEAVLLASSRLAVSALTPDGEGNRLTVSEDFRSRFFAASPEGIFLPGSSYKALVAFLVFWDSNLYWQRLREKAERNQWHPYVTDSVKWSEEKIIQGYLDFSQSFHDAVCVHIYRIALQRLQGVAGEALLVPTDPFVTGLIEEHNARQGTALTTSQAEERPVIMVGSVRVTGASRDVAYDESAAPYDVRASICFFNHQDSEQDDKECLLLWPKTKNWLDKHVGAVAPNPTGSTLPLARIGRTPAVGRGGDGYFRLPRSTAFAQSSKASYQDWQGLNPCIVKLGHWQYQSNHDLLTVDIWKRLYFDVITRGGALQYLLGQILGRLGVKPEDLGDENGRRFAEDLPQVDKPAAALVYNSHPSTDFVLHQLVEILPDEFAAKIVGLRPLRHHRAGSSLLVSPFALDRLKDLLKSVPDPHVILFDDAEITGRNLADLEALLTSAGAASIHALTVLDRRRLPTAKPIGLRSSYWRYDVPVMGKEDACPLCRALDTARKFRSRLLVGYDDVLRAWEQDWSPMSPLTHWGDHGLDPVAVQLRNQDRPYPTDTADETSVKLQTSVGLAIYLAEMHSMTFHDDLVFELLEEEGDTLDAASSIQILASQFLLFGGEYGRKLKGQMLVLLLGKMLDYEPADYLKSDRHLSFGALVFLAQPSACIEEICPKLIDRINVLNIGSKPHGQNGTLPLPIDLRVLIAWLAANFPTHFANANEIFNWCRRLLQPQFDTIGHIYDTLFREIYDDDGYTHRGALPKIARVASNEELSNWSVVVCMLQEGTLSARRLIAALDKIDPCNFRAPPAESATSSMNVIHDVRSALEDAIQRIQKNASGGCPDWQAFEPTKEKISKLRERLTELIKLAYLDIDVEAINGGQTQPLGRELEALASRLVKESNWQNVLLERKKIRGFTEGHPKFYITPNGQPFEKPPPRAWVLWDTITVDVVRHLMVNVIHSNVSIEDPWKQVPEPADMWIRIVYRENSAIITFVNGYELSPTKKTRDPTLPLAAKDLGLEVRCHQQGNLWYAHLALPRAGRLAEFLNNDPFHNLNELEAS